MSGNGLITVPSKYSFAETVRRLEEAVARRGVKVFAKIDHSGEAEKVGLAMPPTCVVIFGNPKAGTPLMLAAPEAAIDLPLKALVAEDREGQVSVSYYDPKFFAERYSLTSEQAGPVAGVAALVAEVTA